MRRPQWQAKLDRELLPFLAWMVHLYGPPYDLRGSKRSNPYRDVLIYLFGSVLRENTAPNRTRPFSWAELHKLFHDSFFAKNERKIELHIGGYDGTYLRLPISEDDYERISGLKFAALGVSGVRNAYAKGRKIVEMVKQKRNEQPERFTEISVRPVKQRRRMVFELVPRRNTQSPNRTIPPNPAISAV